VTHSPYARAPDLTVTLSRIAVQYLTLIFHQHTEAKEVITSKTENKKIGRKQLRAAELGERLG
jgi:flavorubredoxin